MFEKIDELKTELDRHRPLSPSMAKNLQEDLILRWTYHSNAIEGNTLTLLETKVVLEGVTVGGKSLREHFEAINHKQAIEFVEQIIQNQEPFNEWQLKNIHQLILSNIDTDNAGRYRTQNVIISGASHTPPDFLLIDDKMRELFAWYDSADSLHPVERACRLHSEFVIIHPFIDGNGRTARLLLNFELMKAGYPSCVITVDKRLAYYEALDNWASVGDKSLFFSLINKCLLESFKPYQLLLKF